MSKSRRKAKAKTSRKTTRLKTYRSKRSSAGTPEPFGGDPVVGCNVFCVQQHDATRLHFDFRLEINGVLQSWAVPRGPSPDQKDKRLAVRTEDHPLEYGEFEGNIPEGNYGAGTVLLWDVGIWTPLGAAAEDLDAALASGKIAFELHGHKLKGAWALVKIKKAEKEWLLIKETDAYLDDRGLEAYPKTSVKSGRTLEEIRKLKDEEPALKRKVLKLGGKKTRFKKSDFSPMLAEMKPKPFSKAGWLFEIKYDGYRIVAEKTQGDVTLYSRNGHDFTFLFPEIQKALSAIPLDNFILDGEMVCTDERGHTSFALLQKRARLKDRNQIKRAEALNRVTYWAFDLLSVADLDIRTLPLDKRKGLLAPLCFEAGPIRYSEHFKTKGIELFEHVAKLRLEGIVAKKSDSKYVNRRSQNWLKIKADRTDDFVVVGFTEPKRSRGGFGALLLGSYKGNKLVSSGRVGTGFDATLLMGLREILDQLETKKSPLSDVPAELKKEKGLHWVTPKVVVEVRFKTWISTLRQPSFITLRDDKTPEECRHYDDVIEKEKSKTPTRPKKTSEKKVLLSNQNKLFWPDDKITKGDLIEYYLSVSKWLLPYLKDRPLVLTRYPDGIEGKSFYQKDAPGYSPDWIRTESVYSSDSSREVRYFIAENKDALAYIINLGTIPLHIWASRTSKLEKPDWCILDLDPKGAPFKDVIKIALATKKLCDEVHLPCFIKTSGSTGLHILIPLRQQLTHELSKALGELLATLLQNQLPEISTIVRNPRKREGKVYIDFLQNGNGKTIASPYCVRPLPGAPVSMPLEWKQVTPKLKISDYTIQTAISILKGRKRDPMLEVLKSKPELKKAFTSLERKLKKL